MGVVAPPEFGATKHPILEEHPDVMTQGEFMDVTRLQADGLTVKEIAEELGFHPATVSKWLATGGPPPRREKADESRE